LIEKSMRIDPEPQPPLAASAPTMALELALGGSASTGVFQGFAAVKSPPTGAPALDEELLALVVPLPLLELVALVVLELVAPLVLLGPLLELVALVVLPELPPLALPPADPLEEPVPELEVSPLDVAVVVPALVLPRPPWPPSGEAEPHAMSASVAADPAAQRIDRRMSLAP
jgi:hypothetical protein